MSDRRNVQFRLLLAAFFAGAAHGVFALDSRPETWFHIIGGNASKSGLTADLEALASAGFGGIQFFHGQFGKASAWDGVSGQIPCLSAKWDDLVIHAADECARLGLSFKMQNCPGWSMSGGPWISVSNAMRKLVFARRDVAAGAVADIPVPEAYRDADSDWRDVCCLAFPTPEGGGLNAFTAETNGNCRIYDFGRPVTIRTLELPSPSQLLHRRSYTPDVRVVFEAEMNGAWRRVCAVRYPQGCWQDQVPFSIACEEVRARRWRLTLESPDRINVRYVRFSSEARLDNYEGLAGHVLRGQLKRRYPRQSAAAYIPAGAVRIVKPGDRLEASVVARWTVLKVGHVNMKKKNHPAPAEATGWECDKLDPRGIEANFAGYIGRLVEGPLAGGRLKGMIVDSWECERQTWTWRMEEWFQAENGYDVKTILPAVFGWVIASPENTEKLLLDWRRTVSGLITRNYYGRMAELAREKGLSSAYETAFGDVIPGDILEYWKYCDTPMCEFWQPYAPAAGGAGHPNFKPVRPCVSAAHLYGKRRVDCEAFTSMALTWDENFRTFKEQAVRHYARGVTHLVFHTCTHNPQVDGRVPGTSFGSSIGSPFVRGQTWWRHLGAFTGWTAACCRFLERGRPVVDALRYLGDELDHRPDELEFFPEGFKVDYLNADVLFNRLDVVDGRFTLPDGMTYSVLWVPDSVMLLPKTRRRLDELGAKGGRIRYGSAAGAVAGLEAQISFRADAGTEGALLWYHRLDGDKDCFFVAADDRGFCGQASFATVNGMKNLRLELSAYETLLLEFSQAGAVDLAPGAEGRNFTARSDDGPVSEIGLSGWTLELPAGYGADGPVRLDGLAAWKDIPALSPEARAFSGTARYECSFDAPEDGMGRSFRLELGEVRDIAKVCVNGRSVALLWAEPYSCDITKFVRPGRNAVEIEVTSSWFNRLAWDFSRPEAERKTWTVWDIPDRTPPCLKQGAELRDSGLLGPARLTMR